MPHDSKPSHPLPFTMLDPITLHPLIFLLLLLTPVLLGFLWRGERIRRKTWQANLGTSLHQAYLKGREVESRLHKRPLDEKISDAYQKGVRDSNIVWTEAAQRLGYTFRPVGLPDPQAQPQPEAAAAP